MVSQASDIASILGARVYQGDLFTLSGLARFLRFRRLQRTSVKGVDHDTVPLSGVTRMMGQLLGLSV